MTWCCLRMEARNVKTFFFIIDEEMVKNDPQKTWKKIKSELKNSKINYKIIKVHNLKQISRVIQQFVDTLGMHALTDAVVISCGRNIFFLEVLSNLLNAAKVKIPVAFIPFEDKNIFAKKIGVSLDPLIALQQIFNTIRPTYYNLVEMDEATHTVKKVFLDEVIIGFNAYLSSLLQNSRMLIFLQEHHSYYAARFCGLVAAFVNREHFAATLRINHKYYFFKNTCSVSIKNITPESEFKTASQLQTSEQLLNISVISSLNPFTSFLLWLFRKFKAETKLPFVHTFKQKQFHLMINSLEFGQIDNRELTNKFYDVFFRIVNYPFWFDVDSVSLTQKKQKG